MVARRALGIVGSLLVMTGVFLPSLQIPVLGSMNYFSYASEGALIILTCAVISLILLIGRTYKPLWITGSVCAIALISTVLMTASHIEKTKAGVPYNVDMFDVIADALVTKIQWGIGIPVMVLGIILIFMSAHPGKRSTAEYKEHLTKVS